MRHYLLPLLAFCAIVVIFFASGVWSLPAGPVPPMGPTLGQPALVWLPQGMADGPVQVLFVDESVTWDWQNACEDEVTSYVAGAKYPVAHLLYTLTDDADLTLGVAYPDAERPEAVVLGGCSQESDILTCRVSVNSGAPGPALDTAVAALLGYGVQDYFRDKSEAGWGQRPDWQWADYVPLVVEDETGWTSECVEVTK
ncbi:MAG: hypothetical protein WBO46_20305 [Caldilineaceae bacterium]